MQLQHNMRRPPVNAPACVSVTDVIRGQQHNADTTTQAPARQRSTHKDAQESHPPNACTAALSAPVSALATTHFMSQRHHLTPRGTGSKGERAPRVPPREGRNPVDHAPPDCACRSGPMPHAPPPADASNQHWRTANSHWCTTNQLDVPPYTQDSPTPSAKHISFAKPQCGQARRGPAHGVTPRAPARPPVPARRYTVSPQCFQEGRAGVDPAHVAANHLTRTSAHTRAHQPGPTRTMYSAKRCRAAARPHTQLKNGAARHMTR